MFLCLKIEAKVLAKLEGESYLPQSLENQMCVTKTYSLTFSQIYKANVFILHHIDQFIGSWMIHFRNQDKYYLFKDQKSVYLMY